MKCKYCNSDMIHISGDLDEYGDNKYKCYCCEAIASEVFGHGIHWKEGNIKLTTTNWNMKKDKVEVFCKNNNISLTDFLKVFQFIMNEFK